MKNPMSTSRGIDETKPSRKGFAMLSRSLFPILLLLVVWLPASRAAEVPDTATKPQLTVTPQSIKAKIKDVEATADLKEEEKNRLLELYRKSLANLETAASNSEQAEKFAQSIETAPAEIKKLQKEVEQLVALLAKEAIDIPDTTTLEDIEQQLLKAKTNVTTVEAQVATLTSQLTAQMERPQKAVQRLREVKKSEEELLAKVKLPPPEDESQLITEARKWNQQTGLQALQSETKMLNQELVSMPVLLELAKAQKEKAAKQLEYTNSLAQRLEAKVNQRRQAEAVKTMEQAEEAQRQVADSPPVIWQTAAENTALGNELRSSTAGLERIAAEKERLGKELQKLEANLRSAQQKVELAGVSQALGLMLREQQRTLPDVRLQEKKVAANEELIAETALRLIQLDEEQKELDDTDAYVAKLTAGLSPEEAAAITNELRGLLGSRLELLGKIITAYQSTLSQLAELDDTYRQLLDVVSTFDAFLAKHLLWMRSIPSLRLKDLYDLPREVIAFFAPGPWFVSLKQLAVQAGSSPILIAVYLLTAVLLRDKKRLRAMLAEWVTLADNPATYRFTLSMKIVALTLLLALPWPLLLMTLGWQIQTMVDATDYSRAVGAGLFRLSYHFYLLRSLRMLLLPEGLAAGLFHWPETTLTLLRRETNWLLSTFIPAAFFTQMAFSANYQAGDGFVFARLLFLAALAALAVSFYRVLHPKTGVWHVFCENTVYRPVARLYPVFFALIMLIPLVFSGLILMGATNSAGMLMTRLMNTLWLALGIIVSQQLVEQWLIQSARQLSVEELEQSAALSPAAEDGEHEAAEADAAPAVNLNMLSAESSKLLDTVVWIAGLFGLWIIWADVLPAFLIFDQLSLWNYSVVIAGETQQVPVTLTKIGLAVFIGVVTLVATRRFPSLLEMVLLRHLDMTSGGRYTVTTLSRYLIGGIGLMSIADIFGFSWNQIQWLVAALGVGIGFGLQEIVANFISGLIILFERPIRVGDTITVGSTDGTVTRIRIRATTIRDFNGRELLVPNKEFISGQLLNWSLSDPVTRILIPVGVAYGSDVHKAMTLMMEAAKEHALVMRDPKPSVTFDSFGDNALALTLRCYIGDVDNRLTTKSDLNKAIDHKFRKAEISIAFPQLDVHLDAAKPIAVRIVREEGDKEDSSQGEEGRGLG